MDWKTVVGCLDEISTKSEFSGIALDVLAQTFRDSTELFESQRATLQSAIDDLIHGNGSCQGERIEQIRKVLVAYEGYKAELAELLLEHLHDLA